MYYKEKKTQVNMVRSSALHSITNNSMELAVGCLYRVGRKLLKTSKGATQKLGTCWIPCNWDKGISFLPAAAGSACLSSPAPNPPFPFSKMGWFLPKEQPRGSKQPLHLQRQNTQIVLENYSEELFKAGFGKLKDQVLEGFLKRGVTFIQSFQHMLTEK